ncbi:MAG: LysR family transcriptional regulator, partial [Candidatus Sericytochromatia bacterium]|nr:LysR family transcriptional regulator [Candidatus Sericytochromatia bacterium]
MEWLNFRHLYAFWMVAKEGSFTRAAEKMFVAQSAVSSQVSALEAYMRQRLLNRTPRSVELTPAGRHLLDYAQAIFAQSRAINALIQDPEVFRNKHRLRLGLVGGVSRYFVYRFLEHLGRKDPDLQVSVTDGSYDELFGMLWRFELDAIITLEPPHKKDMGEVYYRKLGESDLCVVGVPAL